MVKATNNILLALVFVGLGAIGGWFVRDWFCADTSEQIVDQLKDDAKEIEKAEKEVEIRYVTRERIKTVVREVPVDAECLDNDYPAAIINGMCQSLDPTRPETDGSCEEVASPENTERVRPDIH